MLVYLPGGALVKSPGAVRDLPISRATVTRHRDGN